VSIKCTVSPCDLQLSPSVDFRGKHLFSEWWIWGVSLTRFLRHPRVDLRSGICVTVRCDWCLQVRLHGCVYGRRAWWSGDGRVDSCCRYSSLVTDGRSSFADTRWSIIHNGRQLVTAGQIEVIICWQSCRARDENFAFPRGLFALNNSKKNAFHLFRNKFERI